MILDQTQVVSKKQVRIQGKIARSYEFRIKVCQRRRYELQRSIRSKKHYIDMLIRDN